MKSVLTHPYFLLTVILTLFMLLILTSVDLNAQSTLIAQPNSGQVPLTVTFTTQPIGPSTAITWSFGDGTTAAGKFTQVHTYTQAGQYAPFAAMASSDGKTQVVQTTINITLVADHTNPYCGPGDVVIGLSASDGPAQLLKACNYTRMTATPTTNPPKMVTPQMSLATVLKTVQCGDVIKIDPHSTTLNSSILSLNAKQCDDQHWVIIESSAVDQLPDEFHRVSPAWAGQMSLPGRPYYAHPKDAQGNDATLQAMPKIVMTAGSARLTDCNHVRLIGIEVTRSQGTGVVSNLMNVTGSTKCIIDRSWFHGTAQDETTRGLIMNEATKVSVINSYFSDFHCLAVAGACTDAQAMSGGNSVQTQDGQFKIVNNYLEGAAETILYGGGPGRFVPQDILVMYNTMYKPWDWDPASPHYNGGVKDKNGVARPFVVKNLFELKNAQRVLLEGNIMQNTWGGFTQIGAAILSTPKNPGNATTPPNTGLCPVCQVVDFVARYNMVSYMAQALQLGCGQASPGGWPAACGHLSIHDIVLDHLGYAGCYQCTAWANLLGSGYSTTQNVPVQSNVWIDHLTIISDGYPTFQSNASGNLTLAGPPANNAMNTPQLTNVRWTNIIQDAGTNGLYSTGGGTSNCASQKPSPAAIIAACWTGPSMYQGNVMVTDIYKASPLWPAGNMFAGTWSAVGFTHLSQGCVDYPGQPCVPSDYTLLATSPLKGKATDGKDPGADIQAINLATGMAQ